MTHIPHTIIAIHKIKIPIKNEKVQLNIIESHIIKEPMKYNAKIIVSEYSRNMDALSLFLSPDMHHFFDDDPTFNMSSHHPKAHLSLYPPYLYYK